MWFQGFHHINTCPARNGDSPGPLRVSGVRPSSMHDSHAMEHPPGVNPSVRGVVKDDVSVCHRHICEPSSPSPQTDMRHLS